MSVPLPKNLGLGGSGDLRHGGFGPGAMVLKDGLTCDAPIPGDGSWQQQTLRLTGKYLKSDLAEIFTYDGTTCRANDHVWINAICDCRLADQTPSKKFLAFLFHTERFGDEYKSIAGFVEGCATTVFADEMYPGDQISVVLNLDIETSINEGDFTFTASPLPP